MLFCPKKFGVRLSSYDPQTQPQVQKEPKKEPGLSDKARRMLMRVGLELGTVRTYLDDDIVDLTYPTPLS
jgi:hypothetical protein